MLTKLLSHAHHNLVGYIALFFALSGSAMAASSFIKSTDTIPAGDLAGTSYGDPLIASGAVTNGKLANSSLNVNSGTGLTGGGSVALGGSTALGVADGGIRTTQLHDGSVTTAKFDSGAKAPDAAKLDGASPSDYGGVVIGRMNGLHNAGVTDFGAASGTSTASFTETNVSTVTPNHALKLRDLSVQLTTAPGSGAGRTFGVSINSVVWTNGCFIDDTATTCTGSTALNVPANSTLSIAETAYFGTPADADARFAFRLTNP
jgi:hypothetical protein